MSPPQVSDYYHVAKTKLRAEVESTRDEIAVDMDSDEWTSFLIRKYGMEQIQLDEGRSPKLVEATNRYGPALRVEVPVIPSDTLVAISRDGLAGSPFSFSINYKEFAYDDRTGTLSLTVPQDARLVQNARDRIHEYVRSLNTAIESANQNFPTEVRQVVDRKKASLEAKHRRLDELARVVGIPLIKQADLSKVVPTAVKVRETIAPILPPEPRVRERPVLEPDKFAAILELMDNQCRQFERTPGAFQSLTEEALRDIILSSLNALFRGAAAGEVFQGLGKVDIHLRISQGEVFIAEVKSWDGPSSLSTVTAQLLDRLTWRDAYGVAILLSSNADFGQVLSTIERTVPVLERVVANTLRKPDRHHFVVGFTLPSDISKQVEVHYLAYNLYTQRASGRVRRQDQL